VCTEVENLVKFPQLTYRVNKLLLYDNASTHACTEDPNTDVLQHRSLGGAAN